MGLLFVILFWAVLFCLALIPAAFVVSLMGRKETRSLRFKRTLLGAILFFPFAFVLNLASSAILGTDIGIGDGFQVRIRNGYSLECADTPRIGGIYKGHECVISGVDGISVRKDSLYMRANNEYVLLDMVTNEVTHNISEPGFELSDVSSYYYSRYWATGGVGLIISALISIVLSIFIARKLVRR